MKVSNQNREEDEELVQKSIHRLGEVVKANDQTIVNDKEVEMVYSVVYEATTSANIGKETQEISLQIGVEIVDAVLKRQSESSFPDTFDTGNGSTTMASASASTNAIAIHKSTLQLIDHIFKLSSAIPPRADPSPSPSPSSSPDVDHSRRHKAQDPCEMLSWLMHRARQSTAMVSALSSSPSISTTKLSEMTVNLYQHNQMPLMMDTKATKQGHILHQFPEFVNHENRALIAISLPSNSLLQYCFETANVNTSYSSSSLSSASSSPAVSTGSISSEVMSFCVLNAHSNPVLARTGVCETAVLTTLKTPIIMRLSQERQISDNDEDGDGDGDGDGPETTSPKPASPKSFSMRKCSWFDPRLKRWGFKGCVSVSTDDNESSAASKPHSHSFIRESK